MTSQLERDIINGGYWMRKPGPNAQVVVAYTGAVAPEAIQAVGLLAITSADRLNAGWTAAQRAREGGLVHTSSHVELCLRTFLPTAVSSPSSTATRQHLPGSAPCMATGHAPSVWSISGKPARSRNSTATTVSMRRASWLPRDTYTGEANQSVARGVE